MPKTSEVAPFFGSEGGGKLARQFCHLAQMNVQPFPLAFGRGRSIGMGPGVGVEGHDQEGGVNEWGLKKYLSLFVRVCNGQCLFS